jgi:hypothetical protein
MSVKNREHALREHLALISTEAYLMLRSADEAERINRYNMVQEQIDLILHLINEEKQIHHSCPDVLFQ